MSEPVKEKCGFAKSLEGEQEWPPKMFKVTVDENTRAMIEKAEVVNITNAAEPVKE